eukprot:COSAG01_NODE_5617_length_4143_cov_2.188180_5_plen_203_part_00
MTHVPVAKIREGLTAGGIRYAGLIPNAILPLFLGGAIKWFPSHMTAFNTFYTIGGAISIVSWLILALFVHPPNEKPGRPWQCTRHWCHGADDPWYHKGGALEGKTNPQVAISEAQAAERLKVGAGAGYGIRCCDQLLFGARIYEQGDVYERQPLLGGDADDDDDLDGAREQAVGSGGLPLPSRTEGVERKQSDPTLGFSNVQ